MAGKKFKFRFEPMLNVRRHKEKERQKEHAEAVEKVVRQKEQLDRIDNMRLTALKQQRNHLSGSISVAEALVYSRYLMKLRRERLGGAELLHGLQLKAEERRVKLVEAAKERKIFQTLKETWQFKHMQELEKAEQKELDEIGANTDRRRKKKGSE